MCSFERVLYAHIINNIYLTQHPTSAANHSQSEIKAGRLIKWRCNYLHLISLNCMHIIHNQPEHMHTLVQFYRGEHAYKRTSTHTHRRTTRPTSLCRGEPGKSVCTSSCTNLGTNDTDNGHGDVLSLNRCDRVCALCCLQTHDTDTAATLFTRRYRRADD